MLKKVNQSDLKECLTRRYALRAPVLSAAQGGYDFEASASIVECEQGKFFLKVRANGIRQEALSIPRRLFDQGNLGLIPPIVTSEGNLSTNCNGATLILYPFVGGVSAAHKPLSFVQWSNLGKTMREVHEAKILPEESEQIRREVFGLPIGELFLHISKLVQQKPDCPSKATFIDMWSANHSFIQQLWQRAQELRSQLSQSSTERVICHTDCHLWNVLNGDDGQVHLLDWDDGPLIAPRERDIFLLIRTDLRAASDQENHFLSGYGVADLDIEKMAYFRIERMLEDLAVNGRYIFLDDTMPESEKLQIARDSGSFLGWAEGKS